MNPVITYPLDSVRLAVRARVGRTPLLRLPYPRDDIHVWLKLEHCNPTTSPKDRLSLHVMDTIGPTLPMGGEVVDASAGSYGYSLAFFAHLFALRAVVFVPRGDSHELSRRIAPYGGKVRSCPSLEEACAGAADYADQQPNRYYVGQFDRLSGADVFRTSLGDELVGELPGLTDIVGYVGTGALLKGAASAFSPHPLVHRVVALNTDPMVPESPWFRPDHLHLAEYPSGGPRG